MPRLILAFILLNASVASAQEVDPYAFNVEDAGFVSGFVERHLSESVLLSERAQEVFKSRWQRSVSSVIGMQLLAVRSGEAEVVMTGNTVHRIWRYIESLHPDYQILGDANQVTLELRDPETRRRRNVEWPRFMVPLL